MTHSTVRALRFAVTVPLCSAACANPSLAPAPHPAVSETKPIEVAITFDDLPGSGELLPGWTRVLVHQRLIQALTAHHVPGVVGFVNGQLSDRSQDARDALSAWVAAGQRVGNHTFSHCDMDQEGVDAFIADIDRNEPSLARLTPPGESYKVFRFPYLREGSTLMDARKIREHLIERGYRVAPVTIEFGDWAFMDPYVRCAERDDARALAALRESFIKYARVFLRWSNVTANMMYGRPIKHVLLLHDALVDAVMIEPLLTAYEQMGVRFISLDDALRDPIYANPPEVTTSSGETFLEQVLSARNEKAPPSPEQPLALLDALCR